MEYKAFTMERTGVFRPDYKIMEGDTLVYQVEKIKLFKHVYAFHDAQGNNLYTITKTRPSKFVFEITRHGEVAGAVSKGFFSSTIDIEGKSGRYTVVSSLLQKTFTIQDSHGTEVGKISRRMKGFRNRYGVALENREDMEYLLCLPVIIDAILRIQSST